METRLRMQIFIVFYILGVNVFQASGQGNSTQMIYFTLTIDRSLYENISQVLTSFGTTNFTVNIAQTTYCENYNNTHKICHCKDGYRWSDALCQSQNCCRSSNCIFSQSPARCIADTTINVQGALTLSDSQKYHGCLASDSQKTECNNSLTNEMKTTFSTLQGFESLTIQNYKIGSVIANFQMTLVSNVTSQDLLTKSINLSTRLNGSMTLVTAGVVQMNKVSNPVSYYSNVTLNCTSNEDLGTNPKWTLQQANGASYDIYNGTQASVNSVAHDTTVFLTNMTELWMGTYSCTYIVNSGSVSINHAASAVVDVALLPVISVYTDPQFPLCTSSNDLAEVSVTCQITPLGENYNVKWEPQNAAFSTFAGYSNTIYVKCDTPAANVTCTFTNRRNQTRSATTIINIIQVGDKYCKKDGPWPNTKVNYSAVLSCTNAAGQQQRPCLPDATWGSVTSDCVAQDLYNVLQKSWIVDTGLGLLDVNGGIVFSQLQKATNDSVQINSMSNINAGVEILSNMQQKNVKINRTESLNDFLKSSSNLLATSNTSWVGNSTTGNSTLAERYLVSVENLVKNALNVSDQIQPKVALATCNSTGCTNSVFNANVTLGGSYDGTVKTTGFQELQGYLPFPNNSTPNSIVVSTTAIYSDVSITIDFPFLAPRRPHVRIVCVAWDNSIGSWSDHGCTWQGASNEARCVCTHLSSFAILMAKKPVELPGSTEITYAGLAVSVASLLACLAVEICVWSTVVKTNTLYLRHTAHFNIALCLLIADCCFLASVKNDIPDIWCQISVVLKHFCYLAVFFWTLCLSVTLLHQSVYLFHNVSKTGYLRFSLVLGYACPFLIVFITFITNGAGAEGSYYNRDGCWLVYKGLLKGSIFTFVIPVGVIIFINVFSMLVVIMKLLEHPMGADKSLDKEKNAAKTVLRTVVLLTPIFGVTWSLGFAVMALDLTDGKFVYAVNYGFILLNSFQGFFLLLTTCVGDRMVRETVRSRFCKKKAPASVSESTTKTDSSMKK